MKTEQQLTAEEAAEQWVESLGLQVGQERHLSKINFIAGWNAHVEQDRWIPVTERVPDCLRWVRVKNKILPHVYDNSMWFEYENLKLVDYVTEWKDFKND